MDTQKEKYTIRLLKINSLYINELINEFQISKIEAKTFINSDLSYNIIIQLDNNENNIRIIKILKKYDIKIDNMNLFISFTTNNEISGFTIPNSIMKFIKKYFNSIDVSIIFLE